MSTYTLLNGYVGSKAPYVSKIKALFDKRCKKYVEPFCGGAAMFFSNHNSRYEKEWINDANPNIACLYKALVDEETRDSTVAMLLEILKPDDKEVAMKQFNETSKKMLKTNPNHIPVEKRGEIARNAFLCYSQSFNCSSKSYSSQKTNQKYKYETKRNLLNALERLKTQPRVTHKDGIDVILEVKDDSETQLYVDWPYVGLYRNESKLYVSEMASLYAHIEGAIALRDSKAAVVMSDYRAREGIPTIYDAIFTGKEWHCYKEADTYKHCIVVENGEHKQRASEYVWTNRVPENAGLYISLHDYKEKITFKDYWDKIIEAAVEGRLVADEILEYEYTYNKLFQGKPLFAERIIEEAVRSGKNKKLRKEVQKSRQDKK